MFKKIAYQIISKRVLKSETPNPFEDLKAAERRIANAVKDLERIDGTTCGPLASLAADWIGDLEDILAQIEMFQQGLDPLTGKARP